jgi:hypothetical protein
VLLKAAMPGTTRRVGEFGGLVSLFQVQHESSPTQIAWGGKQTHETHKLTEATAGHGRLDQPDQHGLYWDEFKGSVANVQPRERRRGGVTELRSRSESEGC